MSTPVDPLADLLKREAPETLYHYTSPAGALGILSSKEAWASSIHFLNDAQEFQQAREVARQAFWRIARESPHPRAKDVADLLGESLERVSRINICVFSLSANGNLLSQWRAYCRRGGYALGFDREQLVQVAAKQGFTLLPCVYQSNEHQQLMTPIATAAFNAFLDDLEASSSTLEDVLERIVRRLFPSFGRVAPAIKHPAFAEEVEWRLVSPPLRDDDKGVGHRATEGLLIPYYRMSLVTAAGSPVRLNQSVIGPSPHPTLANDAFGSLLRRTGTPWKGYSPSHIPFRDM